jgi:hypothetical protein
MYTSVLTSRVNRPGSNRLPFGHVADEEHIGERRAAALRATLTPVSDH